jgi:DNA-binding NarL/FixJ family response regulator
VSVRLVLVDDHRVLREALAGLLAKEAGFEIVGEASSGQEALGEVAAKSPDVLVLDIALPGMNGIEVARRLREAGSRTRVLMLSTYGDRHFVKEAVKAGAAGYVPKTAAAGELARAVRAVAHGQNYFSPEVAGALVASLREPEGRAPPPASVLGKREREVLRLLAEGVRSPQIAAQLGISPDTVGAHRRNIMRKLGLRGVAELTRYAVREGLVHP